MAGLKFEAALEKLENIVNDLESGDVALEEALKKYEEGIKLARSCQVQLDDAEQKIKLLSRDTKGNFLEKDFEIDDQNHGD